MEDERETCITFWRRRAGSLVNDGYMEVETGEHDRDKKVEHWALTSAYMKKSYLVISIKMNLFH